MACIVNAANEVAVARGFLEPYRFLEMSDLIRTLHAAVSFIAHPTLEDYVKTDGNAGL